MIPFNYPRPPHVLWWRALALCCVLVSVTLARAEFATNPVILSPVNALMLDGRAALDFSGSSVSGVGDMNGDGLDDFVVCSDGADPMSVDAAGQAYLLFGRNASSPWTPNPFPLSSLDGTNGVTINGRAGAHRLGASVAGVQDVNGDGCNDMIIGTLDGHVAYVVFGVNGTWPAVVNLVQGEFNGVTLVGRDGTGRAVSSAGDVNNDTIPDIAIGSEFANPAGGLAAGRVDVLYGRSESTSWPQVVLLDTYVNESTGFTVLGDAAGDMCGSSVSKAGDVNGDGVDDVAIGCVFADPHDAVSAGLVAVVFGSAGSLPNLVSPSDLDGTNGFVVVGRAGDKIGNAVAHVGDVNADGLDDFAIGGSSTNFKGEVHVLFGRNASLIAWPVEVNVSSLDGSTGFTLSGSESNDRLGASVSAAGDVDADGIDDFLVGAYGAGAANRGRAFLLYGRSVWPAKQTSQGLADDGGNSTTFEGSNPDSDNCGSSVGYLGDVNGDGRGDLAIGCPFADLDASNDVGQTAIVFGPLFTPVPTTAAPTLAHTTVSPTTAAPTVSTGIPTTASVTTAPTASPAPAPGTPSPTPATCATQGAFVPPGSTCVNGVLATAFNTTVPLGVTSMVITSVTVTGGASFEQPSGSTLVFVAKGSGSARQSTSIAVEGGGCASIGGDAVVDFDTDPSNGGVDSSTGAIVLVTADCVLGKFGAVSATTSFEGDECVALSDGQQETSGNSISVSFTVSNACDDKSSGLKTWMLGVIVAGGVLVTTVIVVAAVKLAVRARHRRANDDVRMMHTRTR